MPYFKMNGYDITKYIAMGGFQLSENDLDSPKSGRTLDSTMYRGKVAEKKRADIKLVPVKREVLDKIMPILRNEYFQCETDMFPGNGNVIMQMYNSTRKYGVAIVDYFGETWYTDASFNVIQR